MTFELKSIDSKNCRIVRRRIYGDRNRDLRRGGGHRDWFFCRLRLSRKRVAEKAIGSAESEAGRIIEDAKKQAETKRKEGVIEAKEEALRIKNEAEAELKERRNEVSRLERRAIQKEENLDKKLKSLEKKENTLEKKIRDNDALREEIEQLRQSQVDELQRVSGMTVEDARTTLLERVETDARHEMAQKLSEIEQQYKETADEKAKNIITLAIQRCAADSVSEATVSVVDPAE